jgi:hypothetical protein
MKDTIKRCSFCGYKVPGPTLIIAGLLISKRRAYICEDCVSICAMIVLGNSRRYPKNIKEST